MPKSNVYRAAGFDLLSQIATGGLRIYGAAVVNIAKGDALHDDTTGYATNATTAFAATFLGIAAAAADNSAGSKGDINVYVIPPLGQYQFIVPVEEDALITQTAVGIIVDLQSVNTVDISDTTIAAGPGFFIDEIDASTLAVAANTYGYAIGHFQLVS